MPALVDGALLRALLEPDLHAHLTPALLLRACNAELFRLLPLVLAAVQRVAETPGQRRAFPGLARALRSRATACPAVKLRLLLLCATPGFADFWELRVVHRASCYPAARAALLAALAALDRAEEEAQAGADEQPALGAVESGSILRVSSDDVDVAGAAAATPAVGLAPPAPGGRVSEVAKAWYKDKSALYEYAVRELFDEVNGVPMRDHKRHLKVIHRSFRASEFVDTVMERVNFTDRLEAVAIAQQLQEVGLITKVGSEKQFADDDKLWLSAIRHHSEDGRHACLTDQAGKRIACWEEAKASKDTEPFRRTELKIAVSLLDLQSLDFWKESVFLKDPVRGFRFGYRAIVHPLAATAFRLACDATDSSSGNDSDEGGTGDLSSRVSSVSLADLMHGMAGGGASEGPGVVTSVKVVKVFSSIARPMIVQLRTAVDGGELENDDHHSVHDPPLLVKEGDNLGQDLSVELMFRCFNALWQTAPDTFPDPAGAPVCVAYEVFPTSAKQGFMEAVSGLCSLKEFDWDNWIATRGTDPAAVRRMVMSAAGSYIGAYVLGAADRHTENVQIQDNYTMLHIDFGFLLGSAPPIDGPQIAIYPAMESAFRAVGAWDAFVGACEDAFISIRRRAPAVVRCAVMLFSKFGFSPQLVRDYLSGPLSLNTHEADELVAGAVVRNLVKHSSQDWKTKFKSYSHDKIDPAFYSLLQAKFGPAIFAMKIVDGKQQAASQKLERAASQRTEVPLAQTASIDD
jgi:hypothetical protein